MDWTKSADSQEASIMMAVTNRNKQTLVRLGSIKIEILRTQQGPGARPRYDGFINGKPFEENIPNKASCIALTVGKVVQQLVDAAHLWKDLAGMAELPDRSSPEGTSEGSGRRAKGSR